MALQLYSSTGQQDPDSVWGQGFLQTVEALGNTAANVISALRGNTGYSVQVPPPTQNQTALSTPQVQAGGGVQIPAWVWPVTALVGIAIAASLIIKR